MRSQLPIYLYVVILFSLAVFVFISLCMMKRVMVFFAFILIIIHWTSGGCGLMSHVFIKIVNQYFFFYLFSPYFPMCMKNFYHCIIFHHLSTTVILHLWTFRLFSNFCYWNNEHHSCFKLLLRLDSHSGIKIILRLLILHIV